MLYMSNLLVNGYSPFMEPRQSFDITGCDKISNRTTYTGDTKDYVLYFFTSSALARNFNYKYQDNDLSKIFSAKYIMASGVFTIPAGVRNMHVITLGGGGGGGSGGARSDGTGSGGGGGGCGGITLAFTAVTPGTTYTANLGVGGSGGQQRTNNDNGYDGTSGSSTTVFYNGSIIPAMTANGGGYGRGGGGGNGGGAAGANGANNMSSYGVTLTAATAGAYQSNTNYNDAGGTRGFLNTTTLFLATANSIGPIGLMGIGGNGGYGRSASQGPGNPGNTYGGGGGGAIYTTGVPQSGGAGADGGVTISYYYSQNIVLNIISSIF